MADAAVRGAYRFGPFHLDVRERRLSRGGDVIPLRLKVFDTLAGAGRECRTARHEAGIARHGVARDDGRGKQPESQRVGAAEGAGRTGDRPAVHRDRAARGLPVCRTGRSNGRSRPAVGTVNAIAGHKSAAGNPVLHDGDGVRLAYATTGNGPPLVKASNWLTHLDFEWGSPIWRHWYSELSRHHRLVRYDERGNGMSQRDVDYGSFDAWVHDLETVVEAAGLDRFPLLGISRGGSIAIAYAVKHPERVTHLVLHGAFAAGVKHAGTPEEIEAHYALASLLRLGWGLNNPAFCKTFTSRFIPEATPEHERWFDELQRVSTSPENAARLLERGAEIDVRPLLPQVKAPTLVLHCDRDRAVPPERGRVLAAGIPGARYVSLPSANHLMLEDEPAWSLFLEELGLFLNW